MWTWLWIAALYAFGMGTFRWLGGVSAAGEAFATWGRTTADRRRRLTSSSA